MLTTLSLLNRSYVHVKYKKEISILKQRHSTYNNQINLKFEKTYWSNQQACRGMVDAQRAYYFKHKQNTILQSTVPEIR